jgi:transposase
MVEPGKVDELSSAAVPSVSGQIIIEASGLLIRIPPDVSADHIERVLLVARVSA